MSSLIEIKNLAKSGNFSAAKTVFTSFLDANFSKDGPVAVCNLASYLGVDDLDFLNKFYEYLTFKNFADLEVLFHVNQFLVRNNFPLINFSSMFSDHQNLLTLYSDYLRNNPLDQAVAIAKKLEKSEKYVDGERVFRKIIEAKNKKVGFSVLRIGDGEGRFVTDYRFDSPVLESYFNFVAKNIWFWSSREFPSIILKENLPASFGACDVLGFSPSLRVDLEYHNNFLGYAGVVEGNRFCADVLSKNDAVNVATNWINQELAWCGFYDSINENFKNLIVVSPHANVASYFEEKFCGNIFSLQIPSENHPLMHSITLRESHYPEAYDRIMNFAVPENSVCLIAGGALGKIYADNFKKKGAVAIDIGSLVDSWMGVKTR